MARYILFLLVFAASALYQVREIGGETPSNKELITPNLNGPATPANTIFRLENEAMEQWRQGNPMRWVEISTDDVIYVDPTLATPVIGTKAYREYLTPILGKVRYDASEFVNPRVALVGDLAVLTYNYHSLRRDVDRKMKRTSFWNTTQVYTHRAGVWKILHSHWSYIGHSQPAEVNVPLPITVKAAQLPTNANEILALEKAAMKRWRQGDPDGFLTLAVPQVTYFDPILPGRLTGIASLTEFYNGMRGKGGGASAVDYIDPRVDVVGDAALLTYRYLWVGRHRRHSHGTLCLELYRGLSSPDRAMAYCPYPLVYDRRRTPRRRNVGIITVALEDTLRRILKNLNEKEHEI